MNIFRRLSAVFRAWMNALVGKMEDPSRMLTTALADMDEGLSAAAGEVGRAAAELKRLERRQESFVAEARAWEQKAMGAVKGGSDELARQCLARRAEAERQAQVLGPQVSDQQAQVERLKSDVLRMKARIEEARSKKVLLEARHKSAEAQKVVLASMEGLDEKDALSAVGKLEGMVMRAEADAEARHELAEDAALARRLDRELAALSHDDGLDDALDALRAKMGVSVFATTPAAVEAEARLFEGLADEHTQDAHAEESAETERAEDHAAVLRQLARQPAA